jgi:hypothetical protein
MAELLVQGHEDPHPRGPSRPRKTYCPRTGVLKQRVNERCGCCCGKEHQHSEQ